MTPPDTYNCPITDCAWTHTDHGPTPLTDPDATDEDHHAQHVLHSATVEHALRAHYETHDTEDWVRLVADLRAELAAARAPLLCLGCYVDRFNAQRAGQPLPPQGLVQLIVNGAGQCLNHVKLQDGPVVPGRTPGGLILGGNGHVPPTQG